MILNWATASAFWIDCALKFVLNVIMTCHGCLYITILCCIPFTKYEHALRFLAFKWKCNWLWAVVRNVLCWTDYWRFRRNINKKVADPGVRWRIATNRTSLASSYTAAAFRPNKCTFHVVSLNWTTRRISLLPVEPQTSHKLVLMVCGSECSSA